MPQVPDDVSYLKAAKWSELLSFLCIGAVTINKPILNLSIKAFPYVPMFIIKPLVYKIYCGGETVKDLFTTSDRLKQRGINNMMLSLTIEAAEGNKHIDPNYIVDETNKSITDFLIPNTVAKMKEAENINSIPPSYVALKPTGFASNAAEVLRNYQNNTEFDDLVNKISTVIETIYTANLKLCQQYPARSSPIVVGVIDAEKHDLQPGVYELQRRLYQKFNKPNQPVSVVGTLQMYLSESAQLLALEEKLAKENDYRLGLKLVRGAYIHSEANRNTIIHKSKDDTDMNYNSGISYCIENIMAEKNNNHSTIGHLVVASHNAESLNLATDKLNQSNDSNPNKNNVVLGQLLGMADNITYNLIKNKGVTNVIKYVPWGPPVETKAYLLRRLEENGDAVKNDTGFNLIKAVVAVLFRRLFRLA
ncbi:FAD-linked oxidoreductase [Yamadazyma tenuis ATCC 10573]|uniref:Proline dehydrogenase n=2 Tax=Candida tenuis TaxID=2315449 RepID=G3BCL2_CANTC|nr:FAD-linked oxidoreductase [Yamadazyma tenuis ATCC 10573]EGV60192.1 FAD-linked oxidoreductase [Yamadazyma tenuis ATCC 10573]